MSEVAVTIKLSAPAYRCMVRELEYHLDSLQREYNTNVKHWGEQNSDRRAFHNRILQVRSLVEELS